MSKHHVTLVEVGPRDGLQNESRSLPVGLRVELVERLVAAGLSVIEAGSFVSPKWVPQMAGTAEVLAGIAPGPGLRLPVLVPNRQGLQAAMDAGVREIAVFTAARLTPVVMPMPSNRWTRSSVATLPVAPGAYGQPPSPPTEQSNVRMPSSQAA